MLAVANFMVVLDMTIANVSIPHIAGSLAVSPNQGTWVITSYAVAEAIIVPLTGWLTARIGTVRLFVFSILGFAGSSLLCAWSPSLGFLIAARVLQGLCGGPIMPLSQTLLLGSYPPSKTGPALAAWAMTTLLAPIAGPVLGGWISDNLAWEWIFYINLPVGAVGAAMIWGIYARRETPRTRTPVDAVGLGLLVLWVGALQLVLDKGRELDWFGSPLIVALALVSALAFVVFVIWELTDPHPVVDLRLFADRGFTSAVLALSLIFGTFFGYIVLLPLWLQAFEGYTALWAGLAVAPMGILSILMAPVVGLNLNRVDPRWFATFAVAVFATVFLWRSQLTPAPSFASIVAPQFVVGLAMSTMFLPLTALALADVRPADVATASGLQNFVRTLFGAFGTALATNYWENGITRHHAALAETLTRSAPAARAATALTRRVTGSDLGGSALIDGMINSQAAVLALKDFFLVAALIVVLVSPLIWMAHRPQSPVDPTQAH
ncbi:MAG: DHA2 family efflux MFS transporter permease subunit [Proteobacteria bacterium]|nr:DHA2 family efflux MFS transporter permease subunit [Pseudomonadota bacterium]